jgi:hypothetical protein
MIRKFSKIFNKNSAIYLSAGIFILMVCSLGITFALGANQMEITGQAYFMPQTDLPPERLPIRPENPGDGSYFVFPAVISQVTIIDQSYQDGDFYLNICADNTNNGNVHWYFTFSFSNPTVYAWTNGAATITPWPASAGGLDNVRFTINSVNLAPTTLITNQTATVQLNIQSQFGRLETQGAAIITIRYNIPSGNSTISRDTRVFFKYYSRTSPECPL